MAAWSAVLEKDGQYHTFLGRVFDALEDRQRDYHFCWRGSKLTPKLPIFSLSIRPRSGYPGRN